MLRLLSWLISGVTLLVAAALLVVVLAVDDVPLAGQAEALPLETMQRAQALLRANDPRKLRQGEVRQTWILAGDLQALLGFVASKGVPGHVGLNLYEGGAEIRYTRPLGDSHFLNVTARLADENGQAALVETRIGQIPVPAALMSSLIETYLQRQRLGEELAPLRNAIETVHFEEGRLQLRYRWQPGLTETARALALTPIDRERLSQAHLRLVNRISEIPASNRASIADVLGPLLQEAGQRHTGTQRSDAYRDILLVTALQLSGRNVSALLPEARQWPRPRPLTLTLQGREDLAQHFVISAALAAWAGEPLASAVGVYKEVEDALKGSGFSFADLAADKAGTRLGEMILGNPDRLAAALAAGLTDAALLPPVSDLPESMTQVEFQRRFGGVDAPAYRKMNDEIDRRIAALALFR
ncbi:hypothetical protein [Zoogloea sp.]|uniref:hypothetical protein n=1 Tax=Zoogloea sp. TaxID=49181 RepID=UPI002616D503|nr:hypothetical protein [Zoogloea sp.]MDD3355038.1 hypothetical protein [Zoogloea sp.]